jgi:hypothetical protein
VAKRRRQERIPGKTLYDRLGGLPLPYEEASSIMFRPSGVCVLIDFGLSHHNQLPDLLQEEFRLPIAA